VKRISLLFTAPQEVAIVEEELPPLTSGMALVRTLLSAISPGTELLVYKGQFPAGLPLDESIPSLKGTFVYPFRYGYSCVGRVEAVGEGVDPSWMNRLVFSFQPHSSHFMVSTDELIPVPAGVEAEQAVLLPNMETALNLVMDGAPMIGEKVVVFGQGIVGLLTTSLLARFPLSCLLGLDLYPLRRRASLHAGAVACLDPLDDDVLAQVQALLLGDADLVFELSGAPSALDQAIAITAYSGRIVVGSWYGQKRAYLDLGGRFHRNRMHLVSSQVSSIAPELTGRWTKARRFAVAWEMLAQVDTGGWITQRIPVEDASQAYGLLDERTVETIQVVLTYENDEKG